MVGVVTNCNFRSSYRTITYSSFSKTAQLIYIDGKKSSLVSTLNYLPQNTRLFSSTTPTCSNKFKDDKKASSPLAEKSENPSSIKSQELFSLEETKKRPIFPWIYSKTTLERVAEKDDLSGLSNSFRSRFGKRLSVAVEMKIPFFNFLVTKGWEKELAENCAWAFRMAVCGLLSRVFQAPFWEITNTDEMLHYDTINSPSENSMGDQPMAEEDREAITKYVNSMIEENLLKLYPQQPSFSAHGIYFQLKPIASRLESAFLVPSLTREDVKKNPVLKGAYSQITKKWEKSQSVAILREMSEELHDKTSHKGTKRSIIIDVSIDCLEIFQLKNKVTGRIIQGNDDDSCDGEHMFGEERVMKEEKVTHLVRFEMETYKGNAHGQRKLGSWKIIDIDDMLNGNVWH